MSVHINYWRNLVVVDCRWQYRRQINYTALSLSLCRCILCDKHVHTQTTARTLSCSSNILTAEKKVFDWIEQRKKVPTNIYNNNPFLFVAVCVYARKTIEIRLKLEMLSPIVLDVCLWNCSFHKNTIAQWKISTIHTFMTFFRKITFQFTNDFFSIALYIAMLQYSQ